MLILRAKSVLPVVSGPIPDGAVVVDGSVIAACGRYADMVERYPQAKLLDLTDCALMPGLVNAHTHLELSDMRGCVPYSGDFVDWLCQVTASRKARKCDLAEVIATAVGESLAAGVTTVGDICYEHRAWRHLAKLPIRAVCFAEVFGLGADMAEASEYLEGVLNSTVTDDLVRLGISPHAPYSAGPQLYRLAGKMAAENGLALTTHLAETAEEIEFLGTLTGPLVELLRRLGKWPGDLACPHRTPVDYFLSMDLQKTPFLLAHVNYINDDELAALAATDHSVVYCPTSSAFFGHSGHRFADMLAAGLNVCLGTDSLASCDSLSILKQMRYLHAGHPDLPAGTILKMGTLNGAIGLGLADAIGSIAPGVSADLAAVTISETPKEPALGILRSDLPVRMTMVAGRIAFSHSV